MKAVVVEFDPNVAEFPSTSLYSKEALEAARIPGSRPAIPSWHLVDGCIKMTYWHAVKYYSNVLISAHMRDRASTFGEAKEFVEEYHNFRNARIEDSLIYLLRVYPPFVMGERGFVRQRPIQLVRNRTSECPPRPGDEPPVEKLMYVNAAWEYELMGLRKKSENDFMGPSPSFYQFLKSERSCYNRAIKDFDKLADRYPEMPGIQADIVRLQGRVADLEAFIAARPART